MNQRTSNESIRFSKSLGRELKCFSCGEFWPADTEFFYPLKNKSLGLHSCCKACYVENRWPNGRESKKKADKEKVMHNPVHHLILKSHFTCISNFGQI